MFFNTNTSLSQIQSWITTQYTALGTQKNGYDVELKPHRNKRSNQQNRFLYAILVALVRFHHETGYIPADCGKYNMDVESLKNYWKRRYGLSATHNLDTAAFGKFIDFIQLTLVEETNGFWEILQPDSAYIQSLIAEGGSNENTTHF